LLYFSSAFRLAFYWSRAALQEFHFGFQTRHLLADRFQSSAVTAKGFSKQFQLSLAGFSREALGILTSVYGPYWAEPEPCLGSSPNGLSHAFDFSHFGTFSPLFSKSYRQFLLTPNLELLYVLAAFRSLGFVPAMSKREDA
jgi:hypothetical protein